MDEVVSRERLKQQRVPELGVFGDDEQLFGRKPDELRVRAQGVRPSDPRAGLERYPSANRPDPPTPSKPGVNGNAIGSAPFRW